jgi:hypothetical protein
MELPNLGYGIIGKPVSYLYGVPKVDLLTKRPEVPQTTTKTQYSPYITPN